MNGTTHSGSSASPGDRKGRTSGFRVLVVAEQLRRRVPGGIGTYTLGLLTGLARLDRDVDVTVMASRPPTPTHRSRPNPPGPGKPSRSRGLQDPPRQSERLDPLSGLPFPELTPALPGRVLRAAWHHGLLGAPGGFDLVHATSFPALRSSGCTSLTVHDLAWRRHPDTFPLRVSRWHEAALRRALSRARHFVVPSSPVADDLIAAGAKVSSVSVIPEGADHLPPANRPGARSMLDRLGVGESYLLSVATLEPRKNLQRLVAAYESCKPSLPDGCALVVAGPAGWGPHLRPTPGVVLAGQVDGAVLSALYEGALACVYVPLYEGFGLPVVEAMRAGTPVVASRVPSGNGKVLEVDPGDTSSIARALVEVVRNASLREELSKLGREHAATFTWANTARAHLELWEALAS